MTETKECQNCKNQFTIEPEDFLFYAKIKVPAPTWCPECRMVRRFIWRNEKTLYRRKCELCEKTIIALYSDGVPFPVYCHECWFSDKWDVFKLGRNYNFEKPFFIQLQELQRQIPRIALFDTRSVNAEYSNQSYDNKNIYLCFAIKGCEDSAYVSRAKEVRNCFDTVYTHYSELGYECLDTVKAYRSFYLQETEGCVDSAFLYNCRNCQKCFGGVNLRNASYVFFGEQLSKGEYKRRLSNLNLGSYKVFQNLLNKFDTLKKKSIFKATLLTKTVNCVGDHLINAKNCFNVFDGFELENVRRSAWVFFNKEVMDVYGLGESQFIYESIGIEEVANIYFSDVTDTTNNAQYLDLCFGCSHLFACIGLRNKQYCILNKQYSKEEYEELVPKIIEHMNDMPYIDSKGRIYKYGEFFPPELSPFAYNETIAQEYFPLTKDEAIKKGYRWQDPEPRNYEITMKTEDIPDHIKDVKDDITDQIIACANSPSSFPNLQLSTSNSSCTTAFKIIPQELQFYRRMSIPLPRLCPNCRHYERLKQRNPLKLWKRQCQCGGKTSHRPDEKNNPNNLTIEQYNNTYLNSVSHFHGDNPCPNTFQTSYAPDRPEIVYCEQCYNAEVV